MQLTGGIFKSIFRSSISIVVKIRFKATKILIFHTGNNYLTCTLETSQLTDLRLSSCPELCACVTSPNEIPFFPCLSILGSMKVNEYGTIPFSHSLQHFDECQMHYQWHLYAAIFRAVTRAPCILVFPCKN